MTEIDNLIKQAERALVWLSGREKAGLVPLPREYIRQVYDRAHPRARIKGERCSG